MAARATGEALLLAMTHSAEVSRDGSAGPVRHAESEQARVADVQALDVSPVRLQFPGPARELRGSRSGPRSGAADGDGALRHGGDLRRTLIVVLRRRSLPSTVGNKASRRAGFLQAAEGYCNLWPAASDAGRRPRLVWQITAPQRASISSIMLAPLSYVIITYNNAGDHPQAISMNRPPQHQSRPAPHRPLPALSGCAGDASQSPPRPTSPGRSRGGETGGRPRAISARAMPFRHPSKPNTRRVWWPNFATWC